MNSTAKDYFELGKKKYFRYDRKGAEESFREALSSEPNDPTALGWLAITLAHLKKYDDAIEVINQLDDRETAEVCIARGIISKHRDGDNQGAIDQYSKAIALDQNNELSFALRGLAYSDVKKETEAFSDIESASKVNPSAYVYIIWGQIKYEIGDKKGSISLAQKAAEIDPMNSRAWAWMALIKAKIENYEQALNDYNKAIELDPEFQWAWANRGSLHTDLGNYQDALNDYNRAIELDQSDVWAIYHRGLLKQTSLNDKQGALADYSKTIKLDASYKWALANRANVRIDLDDIKGALADFDKAIEIDPSYVFAINCRGNLKYRFLNDRQGALIDFNDAIELDPSYKWAWANRGSVKADLGDNQEALNDLNKALEIDKNYFWVLKLRAKVYESLGQYELCLADRSRYYEMEEIPKHKFKDPEKQDIFDSVYAHFHESIRPELLGNGEKFVEYWECFLYWGAEELQSLHRGRTKYTYTGNYGMGYLCLTDRFLRIVSIGSLSKKYGNKLGVGLGKKILAAFLNNFDFRSIEKEDRIWAIPFKDIQGIYQEDGAFQIVTPKEGWEVFPYWSENEYIHFALELARSGNLRKLINVDNLSITPMQSNADDKIFEKIERLASLREKGIITSEEFEQKKKELLARI
jgi:tetratricopeptide (TPR) repeat protein